MYVNLLRSVMDGVEVISILTKCGIGKSWCWEG